MLEYCNNIVNIQIKLEHWELRHQKILTLHQAYNKQTPTQRHHHLCHQLEGGVVHNKAERTWFTYINHSDSFGNH